MPKKLLWLLLSLGFMLLPTLVSAKEIQMYDQPSNNAKAIGKIDLSVGIIPIYIHPQRQWVRVGDPRNGNVGWVRTSEVNNNDGSSVTVTQQIVKDANAPNNYQSIEFGKPIQIMSQEEIQAKISEWSQDQQKLQQDVLQFRDNAVRNMLNAVQQINDATRAQYEKINTPGAVPMWLPVLNAPVAPNIVTKPPVKIIPPNVQRLKNEPPERTPGIPAQSPEPGYSLERPASESTAPVAGTPATQPTPGTPSTEPTPGTKPAGPSRY